MADDTSLDALGAGKYLLITTYRKNGTTVPTPVWVVRDGDALGIWTVADSWKVKRIRNRADVLVGPCDVRGNPTGDSVPARAEILDSAGLPPTAGSSPASTASSAASPSSAAACAGAPTARSASASH